MAVAVLLDTKTLSEIKTNLGQVYKTEYIVLSSLDEIMDKDVESLIVFGNSLENNSNLYTLELLHHINELHIIVVTDQQSIKSAVQDFAEIVNLKSEVFDSKALHYLVSRDPEQKSYMEEEVTEDNDVLIDAVAENFSDNADVLKVVSAARESKLRTSFLLAENKKLTENIKELELSLDRTLQMVYEKESLIQNFIQQASKINKDLFNYRSLFSQVEEYIIDKKKYELAPNILLFKEHRNFEGIVPFIETMHNSLMYQHNKTCKVFWLLDGNNPQKIVEVPKTFRFYDKTFSKASIHEIDFIVAINYKQILEYLFENVNGVDILIVVDSRMFNTPLVIDDNLIVFNLLDNSKYLDGLNILNSNTITNDTHEGLVWDDYTRLEEETDIELFARLTAKPIIKFIIDVIEERW